MTPPRTPEALTWLEQPTHAAWLGWAATFMGAASWLRCWGLDNEAREATRLADVCRAKAEKADD